MGLLGHLISIECGPDGLAIEYHPFVKIPSFPLESAKVDEATVDAVFVSTPYCDAALEKVDEDFCVLTIRTDVRKVSFYVPAAAVAATKETIREHVTGIKREREQKAYEEEVRARERTVHAEKMRRFAREIHAERTAREAQGIKGFSEALP